MTRKLDFYKISKDGSVALTQLAKTCPKARLLIDWIAMVLTNRGSTSNAVMVDGVVLQSVLGCKRSTVTRAIESARASNLLGVARSGNNRIYYLNPKAIKMDNVSDHLYMFDAAIITSEQDYLYKAIKDDAAAVTWGIQRKLSR